MATTEGTLRAPLDRRAPRWRAIVAASVLVGALWSTGFAAGRFTASTAAPNRAEAITALPQQIRPHGRYAEVKVGRVPVQPIPEIIRPRNHGAVKGG